VVVKAVATRSSRGGYISKLRLQEAAVRVKTGCKWMSTPPGWPCREAHGTIGRAMQAETRLDRVTCMSLGISARGGFQRARHR